MLDLDGDWGYRRDMQGEGDVAPPSFRYWEMLITVVRGPYKGREFVFTTDVVTVGKAPQNDIPLPDETVSRQHLEILRDAKGHLLRDLGSTNGTFLDGAEIREAFLRTGSQVTVGETRFRFRAVQRRVRTEPFVDDELEGLVGTTPEMKRAFALARGVAPLDVTVLIVGEGGTGRRSLARVIHGMSSLQNVPLSVVDCGAATPPQLEKALFHPRAGAVERVEGGTVVLVEPWDAPRALQKRLAEAIRRRRSSLAAGPMASSGGGQRYIAVTSRELHPEVERGRLDEQLWNLLDRVRIDMPPLRERSGDLAPLVSHFVAELEADGKPVQARSARAVLALADRLSWVGNVAALREAVLALGLVDEGEALAALEATEPAPLSFDPKRSFGQNKVCWVESFERRYLSWLMERHGGNVSAASRAADMDRKHLHRLLVRHGLRPPRSGGAGK